jgi:hypothetical protein
VQAVDEQGVSDAEEQLFDRRIQGGHTEAISYHGSPLFGSAN